MPKDVQVRLDNVRVFPRFYLHRYRTVSETIKELDDEEDIDEAIWTASSHPQLNADRVTFVMNISCGELTEQASDIINAVAENGMDFQVNFKFFSNL